MSDIELIEALSSNSIVRSPDGTLTALCKDTMAHSSDRTRNDFSHRIAGYELVSTGYDSIDAARAAMEGMKE